MFAYLLVVLIIPVIILGIIESFSDFIPRKRVKDPDVDVALVLHEIDELIYELSTEHCCDVCGKWIYGNNPTCSTCLAWSNAYNKPADSITAAIGQLLGFAPEPEPLTIWNSCNLHDIQFTTCMHLSALRSDSHLLHGYRVAYI